MPYALRRSKGHETTEEEEVEDQLGSGVAVWKSADHVPYVALAMSTPPIAESPASAGLLLFVETVGLEEGVNAEPLPKCDGVEFGYSCAGFAF